MEKLALIDKIESLPEILQAEIVDFVDFLLQKYKIEKQLAIDESMSEQEKQVLLRRHQAMREKPETNLSLADFKHLILEKYASKQ